APAVDCRRETTPGHGAVVRRLPRTVDGPRRRMPCPCAGDGAGHGGRDAPAPSSGSDPPSWSAAATTPPARRPYPWCGACPARGWPSWNRLRAPAAPPPPPSGVPLLDEPPDDTVGGGHPWTRSFPGGPSGPATPAEEESAAS